MWIQILKGDSLLKEGEMRLIAGGRKKVESCVNTFLVLTPS